MASKCSITVWICVGDEGVKGTGMILLAISSISLSSRTSGQRMMRLTGLVVPNCIFVAWGARSACGSMYWRLEVMEVKGEAGQVEEGESTESDMDASEVPLL
jgi:hypothetical protein